MAAPNSTQVNFRILVRVYGVDSGDNGDMSGFMSRYLLVITVINLHLGF